jgi:protein-S-isoprenylcysteine O-methyltransferase Ste14
MSDNTDINQKDEKTGVVRGVLQRVIQITVTFSILGVILFASAGHLDWLWAWVYFGASIGILIFNATVLLSTSPEAVSERGKIKGEQTKRWDIVIALALLALMLSEFLVAGLDERLGWSPDYSPAAHIAVLGVFVLAQLLQTWSMVSNPFFEQTVRIQEERKQTVATGGPYGFVRHPGYAGMIVTWLVTPVIIGSLWGLIPGGLIAVTYIIRTALEDETLQEELPGYREYARQTRYRLLPGVW